MSGVTDIPISEPVRSAPGEAWRWIPHRMSVFQAPGSKMFVFEYCDCGWVSQLVLVETDRIGEAFRAHLEDDRS